MKKLICILFAAVMLFTAACSESNIAESSFINETSEISGITSSEDTTPPDNSFSTESSTTVSESPYDDGVITDEEFYEMVKNGDDDIARILGYYTDWGEFFKKKVETFTKLIDPAKLKPLTNFLFYRGFGNTLILEYTNLNNQDPEIRKRDFEIYLNWQVIPTRDIWKMTTVPFWAYPPTQNWDEYFHGNADDHRPRDYQYVKEGIPVYINFKSDERSIQNLLFVYMKIEDYVITVVPSKSLELKGGLIFDDRWPTEEEYAELTLFEDNPWLHELFNIYTEDSEFVKICKEIVADHRDK